MMLQRLFVSLALVLIIPSYSFSQSVAKKGNAKSPAAVNSTVQQRATAKPTAQPTPTQRATSKPAAKPASHQSSSNQPTKQPVAATTVPATQKHPIKPNVSGTATHQKEQIAERTSNLESLKSMEAQEDQLGPIAPLPLTNSPGETSISDGGTHSVEAKPMNADAYYLYLFQKYQYKRWKLFSKAAKNSTCFTDIIFSNPTNDTLDVYLDYNYQPDGRFKDAAYRIYHKGNYNKRIIILPYQSVRIKGICSGAINYNAVSHDAAKRNDHAPAFFDKGYVQLQMGDAHITFKNEY